MSKFTDTLWRDLVREHGPALAATDRPQPGRSGAARFIRRPRMLAGGSLGLAGVAAALAIVLSAGGAAAPAAFAVTRAANGSVLVHLNYVQGLNLPQLEQKLTSMGTGESVAIQMAKGAATTAGPVKCSASGSGPAIEVLVGQDGTEAISAGQSAGNTAEGSFHLVSCAAQVAGSGSSGNSGNSGSSGAS